MDMEPMAKLTGAWQYNRPCAQKYVCKFQSCMVISDRLIVLAPVHETTRTRTAAHTYLCKTVRHVTALVLTSERRASLPSRSGGATTICCFQLSPVCGTICTTEAVAATPHHDKSSEYSCSTAYNHNFVLNLASTIRYMMVVQLY